MISACAFNQETRFFFFSNKVEKGMFLFIFFYRTTFGVEKPVFVSEKQQQKNVSTKQDKYTAKGYEHSVTATAICCNGRNQKSSLEDSSCLSIKFFNSF